MKKLLTVTLAFVFAMTPLACLAQEYTAISDLAANPPARWTQTYVTKWRTVTVDALPAVPKAESMPILKVVPDLRKPDVSALPGWTSDLNSRGTFSASIGNQDQAVHDLADEGVTTTTNYYMPSDMAAVYSKNNPHLLGDVIGYAQSAMASMGENPDQWDYAHPTRVFVNTTVGHESDEPLLPDTYCVTFNQKLCGIPLLTHVLEGINTPREDEMWMRTDMAFDYFSPECMRLIGKQAKITEVLSADVPLCGFDKVRAAVEEEIYAGHIRKIFDVELGYALYNEPGKSRTVRYPEFPGAVFYAVPVWRITCFYVENPRDELRDYTGTDVPERGTMEYKPLLVNAQTGTVIDRSDNRKGCGDYQGFISW